MAVDSLNATATAGVESSRARIAGAIKQAADTTGTSFEYMLATAKMESNFNPKAAATTSSARGLYQFIDQTWLGTVKEAGSQLGYGKYADAITRHRSGGYSVSDPAARDAIMKLRNDPEAASTMAAVFAQSNSFKLTGRIGRRPTDGELYMAHFMGANGAGKLISNAENNPNASGAALFPNAAAANRPIFYDRAGRARSVSEVYSVLDARYASAANSQATRTAMASVGGEAPRRVMLASAAPATAPVDNAAYLSGFPDSRAVTPATMSFASAQTAPQPTDPIFRSLFQAGERAQPLSPAVQELWGNSSSLTRASSATSVGSATSLSSATSVESTNAAQSLSGRTPEVRPPGRLDLFSDRLGIFS